MVLSLKLYFIAICWFLLHSASSVINDIITKYTGMHLPSFEIAFFRFLFSAISLLPFILYYGAKSLRTSNHFIHVARGGLLFIGMCSWTYGLRAAPVTTATVISFSIPLFTLILAMFFLKENIIWQRWVVTIIGFTGIIVTLKPHADDFNPEVLLFIFAAIAFALLDVINKKFIIQESMLAMLFYSALVTTLLAMPATILHWKQPTLIELIYLAILGCSANLILFFILKAFAIADATALAPYRYFELLFSGFGAYLVFHEIPAESTMYGAIIIIPTTLFIIYSEKKAILSQKHYE
jgi:S-adenosylmethionine uptake transporter